MSMLVLGFYSRTFPSWYIYFVFSSEDEKPSVRGALFCSGRHWVGGGHITHHSVNTGGCIFFLTTCYRILICFFFFRNLIVGTDIMHSHYVCRVCLLDLFFLSLGACSDIITPVFLDGTTFSLGWLLGGIGEGFVFTQEADVSRLLSFEFFFFSSGRLFSVFCFHWAEA